MTANPSPPQKNFWLKFFEIFCLILVVIGLFQLVKIASQWEYQFVSNKIKYGIAVLVIIAISLLVAFLWKNKNSTQRLHIWLQGIITFYVAFEISDYGFAKLLKTQFQPPQYILDTPIGDLNGFWLTWVYYGHSQTLAYILGATQVGGCILLLFRKTRLAGVFILLPVMVNIILVNHFYDISALAYFNSVHYTFILLFLLLLDYDKLKIIFSYPATFYANYKIVLLNLARFIVIGGAFFNIFTFKKTFEQKTKLNGEWKVESVTMNNIITVPNEYQDSVFSTIYFEWRYGCVFKYSANKFEDKDLYGEYKTDEKNQSVLISFYAKDDKRDTANLHYQFISDSVINMAGKYKSDSIMMKLKRMN